jgi:hypothetical protein
VITKVTVRAPEGQNIAHCGFMIFHEYVHGQCQSGPHKIKEI